MKKEILINKDDNETRIAFLEDNVPTEVHYERYNNKNIIGNVYKGKVLNVLPGLDSAFIDIGQARATFLFIDEVRTDIEDGVIKGTKRNIKDLLKQGESIMVQIIKAPIGTKGARVTCNITLTLRNLVFLPNVDDISISKQIKNEKERGRLRRLMRKYIPKEMGVIVRTFASGSEEFELVNDVRQLNQTWQKIEENYKKQTAPCLIYEEVDLVQQIIREFLSNEISKILVDDETTYHKIHEYLKIQLPHYTSILEMYKSDENIFHYHGVQDAIEEAQKRQVGLASGGTLVIDQSEAMTCIDVNTGRFTGKDSHENTIMQINLEAIAKIVQQIRLRNIGGIIIVDFIDIDSSKNRNKLLNTFKQELKKDSSKIRISSVSELGLVEMTRKRSFKALVDYLCDACPYCLGRGRLSSALTIAHELYRDVASLWTHSKKHLIIYLHPDTAEYVEGNLQDTFSNLEKKYRLKIFFKSDVALHIEQYEIIEFENIQNYFKARHQQAR